MADKKILIDIQANTRNFVKEIQDVNQMLSNVASTFSTMSTKMDKGFADLASSSSSANRTLSTMERTLNQLVVEIRQLNTVSTGSSNAMNQLGTATSKTTVSFNKANSALDMFMKNMSPVQIQRSVDAVEHLNSAFNRLGGLLPPIGRAFEWNLAYDLVQIPGRAVAAATRTVQQSIRETSSLEGEIYDLEAFLGGVGGVDLIEFAKNIGKTGTDEQLKGAALQELQTKILSVGQESTFTALEIARATTEAAKAGVSISEIAGPTGTALDAINLLAQNTGETLENSATNLSKLQNLFENSLSKTQQGFGQAADTGKQFQIIVDGLATADMSAAATADQLTQALFNVGGSAQNLNMSFFETVSLVASMVPAFESAASAGTSLKYMFSALSGGRSVKAQGALKELGLMDEYGQTVFFDKKGFKGLPFMVEQLRAAFGDDSGMAVDVRNRLITDIFGQDALKAVSRLVSMTEEQTDEMLQMAGQLQANAAAGVQSAKDVAAIKNEGLEYDLEVFKGTMDSLGKTLTMPLLKPMSNFVQTFSAIGNAAFEVMTGAGNAEEVFKKFSESEVFQKTMMPGAVNILRLVVDYSKGLAVALKAITENGFNMKTLGTAVAALLGTPVENIEKRGRQLTLYFIQMYRSISDFITELPATLNMIGDAVNYGFDTMMSGFGWLQSNWDGIIEGVKAFASAWLVFQGLQVVSTVVSIASGLASLLTSLGGMSGIIASVTGAFATLWSNIQLGFYALFPFLFGTKAGFFSAAWRAALIKDLGILSARIVAVLITPWTPIIIAVGAFVALFMNNINGLRDFINERFGHIGTYVLQSVQMMGAAISQAWEGIGKFFQKVGQMYFVDGFANMFKGVFQILEGAVVVIGGILKTIVGIFTLNGDLIKSGIGDVVTGVGTAVMGVLRTLMGFFQGTFTGVVEIINSILVAIGAETVQIPAAATSKFFEQGEKIHKDLYDMGAKSALNYTQGVSDGIRQNSGMVYNAATGMMEQMDSQAKESVGIESPSTHGFFIGQMFGMGIVNGLTSFTNNVANAVAAMMSPMSGAEIVVPNIKVSGTPTASGASALPDTIGPRADAVITSTPGPVASPVVGTPVPAGYTPGGARPASTSNFVEPKPLGFKLSGDYYSPGNMVPAQIADYVQNHDMQILKNALAYSGDFYSRFGSEGVQNLDKILAGGYAYGSDLNSRGEIVASRYVSGSKENIYTRDPVETLLRRMGYGSLDEYQASQDFANAQKLGSLMNAKATGKYELDYRDVVSFDGSTPTFERKNIEDISERITPYVPTASKMQRTGVTGVFSVVPTETYMSEEDKSRFDIGNSTGKILTRFDANLKTYTTSIVKSNKITAAASNNVRGVAKDLVTYNTGFGYKSNNLSDKQFNDSVKQIIDMGTVGAQYAIETITKDVTEGGRVNYKNDPYGYAEQAARGDQTNYENMYVQPVVKTITTTIKRLLTPDEINAINPDQAFIPITQIPQAATFESLPSLHGYSTDDFDVAKSAKGFQMAYGEKGIAQRGLTDFFENNTQAMDTLNNIGNRAATFLSLKRGKLTPEDVVLYKKYLAQDKADRQAYLQAAKVARDEMAATNADTSLTGEQKKTANAASMAKLNAVGEPMTTGYTDVYGVKVGSMTDYASGAYNVPEEMKQYTDPIIGSVNDAIFEAVANSEEFKKLPKEEQDRIIKAAQNMPLQSMALLSDALVDGFLDSDEVQNLWTYAGEDIATIRNMIAEGRGPSADDRNLAFAPFIDGIASFVRREDISGDLAESLFAGWDNIVANKFGGSGQAAWKAFSGGFDEGVATLTVADLLQLDPANLLKMNQDSKKSGKGIGEGFNEGVEEGLSADEAIKELLLELFGEKGKFVTLVKQWTESNSPSDLWRDEVGIPMMQGVIEGVANQIPAVQAAFGSILQSTETIAGKKTSFNVFEKLGTTAADQFVIGFGGIGQTMTLSVKLQEELLKVVNVENPSKETIVLLDEFETFGSAMGTAFNDGFGLIVREVDAETTGVGRHLLLVAQWAAGVMPTEFYQVGTSIVEGITQGVGDPVKYAGLKAKLEELARNALADTQAAINSRSPSKLFADEVGSPIVEGIAMGISQGSSSVSTALRKATTHASMFHSTISPTALNGAATRSMSQNNIYNNNYNLGVTTNQSPQIVKRSFAVMKSFKGDL